MKKISFILFFVIFGCAKPEVDLRIVDAADIFDQVATHVGQDVVLVNFWATHCSPCIEEMPYILELEQEYNDQGFKLYFVSNDWLDRKNAVLKFLVNIGVRGISFLTAALTKLIDMPAEFGSHGPGDITIWLGFNFITSVTEILSFLYVSTSAPTSLR